MTMRVKTPLFEDPAVIERSVHIVTSYDSFFVRPLLGQQFYSASAMVKALYHAPVAIVSHDADNNFCFGNRAALHMFKRNLEDFIGMDSSLSAAPMDRGERERLLQRVYQFGFADDYTGIRITGDGGRIKITNARIWNVTDDDGAYLGQAAMIPDWQPVY